MFGRAIWDKLPNCISENFEIFKNHEGIYPKNHPNQTCGYWLITPNQQTFCTETNIFEQRAITNQRLGIYKVTGNYKMNSLTVQC